MKRFFDFLARGATLRTEVLAGATTFLTMAYILVVNPQILAQAGIDPGAAFVAICLAAAIGSALMGLLANLPIALAPGMGLNAYFTFAVVLGANVTWQAALGAVFLSGLLFLAVSLLRVREWLVNGIPLSLKLGIAAGIGFFLGLIGLRAMGLVAANPATLVGLGPIGEPATLLACAGFVVIAGLSARGVPGAIVIGILSTAALGIPLGLTEFQGLVSLPPSRAPTFLQLDIAGALGLGVAGIIFTFLIVEAIDRLSREPLLDGLETLKRIVRAGWVIVTAEDGNIYDEAALNGPLAHVIVAKLQQANGESVRKSDLVGDAWEGKRHAAAERGEPISRHCPGWLRLVPKPGSLPTPSRRTACTSSRRGRSGRCGAFSSSRRAGSGATALPTCSTAAAWRR